MEAARRPRRKRRPAVRPACSKMRRSSSRSARESGASGGAGDGRSARLPRRDRCDGTRSGEGPRLAGSLGLSGTPRIPSRSGGVPCSGDPREGDAAGRDGEFRRGNRMANRWRICWVATSPKCASRCRFCADGGRRPEAAGTRSHGCSRAETGRGMGVSGTGNGAGKLRASNCAVRWFHEEGERRDVSRAGWRVSATTWPP